MTDVKQREAALAWLPGLTEKQFAEFFVRVTALRSTGEYRGEVGHFVLADARFEPVTGRWSVDFIGLPEGSEAWDDDAPICQSGVCSECSNPVRSWAKRLVCPVCGAPAHGT